VIHRTAEKACETAIRPQQFFTSSQPFHISFASCKSVITYTAISGRLFHFTKFFSSERDTQESASYSDLQRIFFELMLVWIKGSIREDGDDTFTFLRKVLYRLIYGQLANVRSTNKCSHTLNYFFVNLKHLYGPD
jgi:hypothetical protein